MNLTETLKRVETILREAEATHTWGTLELCINDGQVAALKQSRTEKFQTRRGTNCNGYNS